MDRHAAVFSLSADRLIALDALGRDLIRLSCERPDLASFLRRVDDYIALVRRSLTADALAAA